MKLTPKAIWHVVLAAQLPALLCGLLTFCALQVALYNINLATNNEDRAREAIKSCAKLQKILIRGWISIGEFTRSGESKDLKAYYESTALLGQVKSKLEEMALSYPRERNVTDSLIKLADRYQALGTEAIALERLGINFAPWRLGQLEVEGQYVFGKWGETSQVLSQTLDEDLQLSPVSRESYARTLSQILFVAMAAVFGSCVVNAHVLASYIDGRLAIVKENSKRLKDGKPLLSILQGKDEIASLDKEFHAMSSAISEATKRERDILEGATDIILTVDESLVVQSANPASIRLWKEENVQGSSVLALTPGDLRPRLQRFFGHCKNTGEAGWTETPLLEIDGKTPYVSIATQWSSEAGLFSCVFHDITARKQLEDLVRANEKRLQKMLDEMPAGIVLVDRFLQVRGMNPIAIQLLGAGVEQAFSCRLPELLGGAGTGEIGIDWLNQAIGREHILKPVCPDAEASELEASVEKITLPGGDYFLVILVDGSVSQKLSEFRKQLLSGISDNMVQPLSEVDGLLASIEPTSELPNQKRVSEYIGIARAEIGRLLKLLTELLKIEGENLSQLTIRKKEVEAQELIARALEAARLAADKRGVTLTSGKVAARVDVDPERIVQVLINLVFNALKYTPSGGYIKIEPELVASNTLELRIIDSGCGIPQGMEEAIFEPFKQTKASDSLVKGGSGLGLFICKSIVERHGGTITASNHAEGAIFRIGIPLKDS